MSANIIFRQRQPAAIPLGCVPRALMPTPQKNKGSWFALYIQVWGSRRKLGVNFENRFEWTFRIHNQLGKRDSSGILFVVLDGCGSIVSLPLTAKKWLRTTLWYPFKKR